MPGYPHLNFGFGRGLEMRIEAARPIVIPGGYAQLIAAAISEIVWSEPNLTLERMWLVWTAGNKAR